MDERDRPAASARTRDARGVAIEPETDAPVPPPAPFALSEGYRLDIQGLRAIAVLSVVLYHADARLLGGGYVGVDIFFVISGYLISRILMKELGTGTYSLTRFYERRVRRLFPALYVMLIAAFACALVLLSPRDLRQFAHTAVATIFFVSNFDFLRLSGYFDGAAEFKPLLHTWSLAVEEQFYILYPPVLALVWRFARKRLRAILLAGGLISLALSAWAVRAWPEGAFYLAPFRAFELLIGAGLASIATAPRLPGWLREGLAAAGLALIAASVLLLDRNSPFPGLLALLPCGGAALMIFAGQSGQTLIGRVLSLGFFTFFGAISYSLYLWHWPFLAFGRHFFRAELTPVQIAVLLLGALAAAMMSWLWIERPFLKRARPLPVLRLGGTIMASGAAAAAALFVLDGLPARFSPEANRLFAGADDYNHRRARCHNGDRESMPYAENCLYGAASAPPVAAVWGDSHGAELVVALGERLAAHGGAVMQITASACPPALGYEPARRPLCAGHNQETFDALTGDERVRTIVLVANYRGYPQADWRRVFEGLARTASGLRNAGKEVVLVYPIPLLAHDPPTALGMISAEGGDPRAFGVAAAEHDRQNRPMVAFLDALRARTGALALRPTEALCDLELCHAFTPQDGALYFNHNHLSLAGARLVMARFPDAALRQPALVSARAGAAG